MIDINYNKKFGFREDYDPYKRIISQDCFKINNDIYFISTIDLGYNMSFINELELYYETMIFKNENYQGIYQRRYSTREKALENHKNILTNCSYLYGFEYLKGVKDE